MRERGEETDSDDNDDEEDDDEVIDDTERDGLESEDMLTSTRSSLQGSGPFPYHGGESTSVRPAETGRTVGPPLEPAGVGGSTTAPEVPVEEGGPPLLLKSQQGQADLSPRPRCRWRGWLRCHAPRANRGGRIHHNA